MQRTNLTTKYPTREPLKTTVSHKHTHRVPGSGLSYRSYRLKGTSNGKTCSTFWMKSRSLERLLKNVASVPITRCICTQQAYEMAGRTEAIALSSSTRDHTAKPTGVTGVGWVGFNFINFSIAMIYAFFLVPHSFQPLLVCTFNFQFFA